MFGPVNAINNPRNNVIGGINQPINPLNINPKMLLIEPNKVDTYS